MIAPQLRLAALHRDPLGVLADLRDKQGDLARFWLGRQRCYSLNSAELVEEVFLDHRGDVGKRNHAKRWWFIGPPSFVRGELFETHEESEHTRARKHFNQTFSSQHALMDTERSSAVIARIYREAAGDHAGVDLLTLSEKALLAAGMATLLDQEPSDEEVEEMIALHKTVNEGVALFRPGLPAIRSRIFGADQRLEVLIAYRSLEQMFARFTFEHPEERQTALSARVRPLDGVSSAPASLLLKNTLPMVEQAASKLCFALLAVAADPHLFELLTAEVDALEGAVDGDALPRLPRCSAAADEALRLLPNWAIGRVCQRPFTLKGRDIRCGDWFIALSGLVHRDERYWPEPEAFRLDRWTVDQVASRPKGAYFPFGFGNRICVARHLTRTLIANALATFFRDWSLEIVSQRPQWKPLKQGDWAPVTPVRARLLHRAQLHAQAPADRNARLTAASR